MKEKSQGWKKEGTEVWREGEEVTGKEMKEGRK